MSKPKIETPACEYCQSWLNLHQPDIMSPDRLLGTCDVCHAWFVIDFIHNELLITKIKSRAPLSG